MPSASGSTDFEPKRRLAGAPAVRCDQAAADTRCHVLCSVGCRRLGTANRLTLTGIAVFDRCAQERRITIRGIVGIVAASTVDGLSDAVACSAHCCRAQKVASEARQTRCAMLLHSALLYCVVQSADLWHEARLQLALCGLSQWACC